MMLIEVLCVVAILVLLVGMLWPAPRRHGDRSRIKCVNNLKNVGLAYRIWATDNHDVFPFEVSTNDGGTMELLGDVAVQFQVLSNELSTPKVLLCPSDYLDYRSQRRKEATNFAALRATNVSYFVGVTARGTNEVSVLGGDWGLGADGREAVDGVLTVKKGETVRYPRVVHAGPNWVFADGSVRQLNTNHVTRVMAETGLETNVLVGVR